VLLARRRGRAADGRVLALAVAALAFVAPLVAISHWRAPVETLYFAVLVTMFFITALGFTISALLVAPDAANLLGVNVAVISCLFSGFVPLGAHEKPLPLEFGADRLVDGDPKTYWATADGAKAAMIEVELDAAKPFDRVVLAEPTWLGQRVRKFRISVPAAPDNNHRDWTVIAEGTTIGHKRIVRVPETKAKYLRVEILDARACPCLTTLSVHKTKVPG
jgi:hypothetical protein